MNTETTREHKDNKIINLSFLIVPMALYIVIAIVFGIKIVIPASVFEALLQVIAILFGFSVVGVFYYLGKTDEYHRDFLNSFYVAYNHLKEKMSVEGVEGKIKEEIKKELLELLIDYRDAIVKINNELRGIVLGWVRYIIISYGFGIGITISALVLPTVWNQESNLVFLLVAAAVIIYGIYSFLHHWYHIQELFSGMLEIVQKMYDLTLREPKPRVV